MFWLFQEAKENENENENLSFSFENVFDPDVLLSVEKRKKMKIKTSESNLNLNQPKSSVEFKKTIGSSDHPHKGEIFSTKRTKLKIKRESRNDQNQNFLKKEKDKNKNFPQILQKKNAQKNYSRIHVFDKDKKKLKKETSSLTSSIPLRNETSSNAVTQTLKTQLEQKYWEWKKILHFQWTYFQLENFIQFPPKEIRSDESLKIVQKDLNFDFEQRYLQTIRTTTLIPPEILKNAIKLDELQKTKHLSRHHHRRERIPEFLEQDKSESKSMENSLLAQGSFGYVYHVTYQQPNFNEDPIIPAKIRWAIKNSFAKQKQNQNEGSGMESNAILKILKTGKIKGALAIHPFLTEAIIGFISNAVCPETTIEFLDLARSENESPVRFGIVMEKFPRTMKQFWVDDPLAQNPVHGFLMLYHLSSHLACLQKNIQFVHRDLRSNNIVYRQCMTPFIINPKSPKENQISSFWDVRIIDLGRSVIDWNGYTWTTWDHTNKYGAYQNFDFDLAIYCSDLYLNICGFDPKFLLEPPSRINFARTGYPHLGYLLPFLCEILKGIDYRDARNQLKHTKNPMRYILNQIKERNQAFSSRSNPLVVQKLVSDHLLKLKK